MATVNTKSFIESISKTVSVLFPMKIDPTKDIIYNVTLDHPQKDILDKIRRQYSLNISHEYGNFSINIFDIDKSGRSENLLYTRLDLFNEKVVLIEIDDTTLMTEDLTESDLVSFCSLVSDIVEVDKNGKNKRYY